MVTRWDPEGRAGAVLVRTKRAHDLEAVKAVADSVKDWAQYQQLGGEVDNVETSPITGTYDWKSYIHEEAEYAKKRAGERRPRKAADAGVAAPTVFYA